MEGNLQNNIIPAKMLSAACCVGKHEHHGYFPWSTFNSRQARNKHKKKISHSSIDTNLDLNFWSLCPTRAIVPSLKCECSSEKYEHRSMERLFPIGILFVPIHFIKGLALPSGSPENKLPPLQSLLNIGTWLVFLPKCVLHLFGSVEKGRPDLRWNSSLIPLQLWELGQLLNSSVSISLSVKWREWSCVFTCPPPIDYKSFKGGGRDFTHLWANIKSL